MGTRLSVEMEVAVRKADRLARVVGWDTYTCHICRGSGARLSDDGNAPAARGETQLCGYCKGVGREWYKTSERGYAWALENVMNGWLLSVLEFLALPEVITAEKKLQTAP